MRPAIRQSSIATLASQFVHQEQADHEQQQGDGDTGKARRLPIGGLVVLLDNPGAFLLHAKRLSYCRVGGPRQVTVAVCE